jgi:hypothetical protein
MRRTIVVAFVALTAGFAWSHAATASKSPTLADACYDYGKSYGLALRTGTGYQKYDSAGNKVFSTTTDPTAQAVWAADDAFNRAFASDPASYFQQDDPLTTYCHTHYEAQYFKGSGRVSKQCDEAMAAYAADPNGSDEQRAAESLAMMTACGSRAEWLQAVTNYTGSGGANAVLKRAKPLDAWKALCDPHHVGQVGRGSADAPACRNK